MNPRSLFLLVAFAAGCAGVPRTEAERPQPPPPEAVAGPVEVGLQAAVLVERRAAGAPRIDALRDGDGLENGDGLRLALELARPAHVLAVYLDSRGQAALLFPSPELPLSNPLPSGQPLDIPLAGGWYTLEGAPGLEGIYVLASPEPLPDVPGLLAKLAALGPGWEPARADQTVAEHLTRGGVRRTPAGGFEPAAAPQNPPEALARPDDRHPGDPAAPASQGSPAAAPERPRPFRRPMLIAGVVRGQDGAYELRQVLAAGGVEVRALAFQHR